MCVQTPFSRVSIAQNLSHQFTCYGTTTDADRIRRRRDEKDSEKLIKSRPHSVLVGTHPLHLSLRILFYRELIYWNSQAIQFQR